MAATTRPNAQFTKTLYGGDRITVEAVRPREVEAGDKVIAWGNDRNLVWTVKSVTKRRMFDRTTYEVRLVIPFGTRGAPWAGTGVDPQRTMVLSPRGSVERVVE